MFYSNIVKISEALNKWNFFKTGFKYTDPIDFFAIYIMRKVKTE